ncbi:hypothetical protein ACLOJK_033102 [Asimina triloba]
MTLTRPERVLTMTPYSSIKRRGFYKLRRQVPDADLEDQPGGNDRNDDRAQQKDDRTKYHHETGVEQEQEYW